VLSTASVPPQQKSLIFSELAVIFHTLPKLILQKIVSYLNLMDMPSAKKYRKELMEERKQFVKINNEYVFERNFNLCEH